MRRTLIAAVRDQIEGVIKAHPTTAQYVPLERARLITAVGKEEQHLIALSSIVLPFPCDKNILDTKTLEDCTAQYTVSTQQVTVAGVAVSTVYFSFSSDALTLLRDVEATM
mgnify:CR=1 FL=1